jgi:hypothetical protein
VEDKIIQGLMELYTEKGVDLSALVNHELFKALPLDAKIRLLKQYATHIHSHTSRGLTNNDIKTILTDAAVAASVGGGIAAIGAAGPMKLMANGGSMPWKTLVAIAGISGAMQGGASLIRSISTLKSKVNNNRYLDALAQNPNDINAIKYLGNQQFGGTPIVFKSPLQKAHDMLDEGHNKYLTSAVVKGELASLGKNSPINMSTGLATEGALKPSSEWPKQYQTYQNAPFKYDNEEPIPPGPDHDLFQWMAIHDEKTTKKP